MYSWVAKTEEIDMLDEAVEELLDQVSKMELKKNTIGIAYVYYDTDFDELAKLLKEKIDFPVVGVSTLALLDNDGYSDYGIDLLVLSDDDVEFEATITSEVTSENYVDEIGKAYSEIMSKRPGEKEKLILTYICKLLGHSGDDYIKVFDELSGGTPVYGAMASDMFTYKDFRVFSNGCVRRHAVLVVAMYGNIKPIVGCEVSVSNVRAIGEKVSEADGIKIYKLGDKTFMQVLKEERLCAEDEGGDVALDYMQTPFVMEVPIGDGEKAEVLRNLIYLDDKDGSGTFLGDVAEDTVIKVSSLRSEDIGKSVNQAFGNLFSRLHESKDYKYRTIICTSCTGRYINLVGDKTIEGNAYKDILPEDINLVGMYSFGEMCPKKSQATGKYYNFFHNETFTILAL